MREPIDQAVDLVKQRVGLANGVQDTYIRAIVESVVGELEKVQGLDIDLTDMSQLMFVVDYSAYRYSNRDDTGAMPDFIKFRLKNLFVRGNKEGKEDGLLHQEEDQEDL